MSGWKDSELSGCITPASATKLKEWAQKELERLEDLVKCQKEYVDFCDRQIIHSQLLALVGTGIGGEVTVVIAREGRDDERRRAYIIDAYWPSERRSNLPEIIADCEWTKKPPSDYTITFYAYVAKPTFEHGQFTNYIWIEKGEEWNF